MHSKQSRQETIVDEKQALIDKNPCGRCRALKLPVCKCKGGGGAGEENDSSDEENSLEMQDSISMQDIMTKKKQNIVEEDSSSGFYIDEEESEKDSLDIDFFDLEEMAESLLFQSTLR